MNLCFYICDHNFIINVASFQIIRNCSFQKVNPYLTANENNWFSIEIDFFLLVIGKDLLETRAPRTAQTRLIENRKKAELNKKP